MYQTLFVFILLNLVLCNVGAQINNGGLDPFGRPILIDTTESENDTIVHKNSFFALFKGKPGRAAFYSLVIPSGGQVYNKRWWKVPLALGVDGGLTYVLIHNRSQYRKSQSLYEQALLEKNPLAGRLKEQRDYFRKWSEYAWVWLIAGHLMTVIDAYVDRQLMDFDISPDLSFSTYSFMPNHNNLLPNISAGITVNLSNKVCKSPNPLIMGR